MHDAEELIHLRAAYAAHVTLVDKYIGRIFETMTDLDMWQDTAFILMTDHGHFLGEHGITGKPRCPQYNALAHIPLMISVPGIETAKTHVQALSANVDLYPTILELFGQEPETPIHGKSLLPLLKGEASANRPWTLYGYYGGFVNVTDGKKTYLRAPQIVDAELYLYSLRWEFGKNYADGINASLGRQSLQIGDFIKQAGMPVGRIPVQADMFNYGLFDVFNGLYSLEDDPAQNNNQAGTSEEHEYEKLLKTALKQVDCPAEQYQRLGL